MGDAIITIMVLQCRVPESPELSALLPLIPQFLADVLSVIFLTIDWNNHPHLFHAVEPVNGAVLWANLQLMFWLSLVLFTTAGLSEAGRRPTPVTLDGWVLRLAGVAHFPWVRTLVSWHGRQSRFAIATGLPLNEWNHVAGTDDGESIRMYINGELGAETLYEDALLKLTKSDFWLGNNRQNTRPYAGDLKDIQLWQRALTSTEIQQALAQTPSAEAAGLLAAWPFAEATSDAAIADQVQAIPVTLQNATAPQTAAGGPQVVPSP